MKYAVTVVFEVDTWSEDMAEAIIDDFLVEQYVSKDIVGQTVVDVCEIK